MLHKKTTITKLCGGYLLLFHYKRFMREMVLLKLMILPLIAPVQALQCGVMHLDQ